MRALSHRKIRTLRYHSPALATSERARSRSSSQVCLKKLSKKDPLTKTKALTELKSLFSDADRPCDAITAALPQWAYHYNLLVLDNSRQVRELLNLTFAALIGRIGKQLAKQLKGIFASWVWLQCDPCREVAAAATAAFGLAFPAAEKREGAFVFCLSELFSAVADISKLTVETLSDVKVIGQVDADDRYERVVSSAINSVTMALKSVGVGHIGSISPQLDDLLTPAFWKLLCSKFALIRSAGYRLVDAVCEISPGSIEGQLKLLAPLILGLFSDKTSSTHQMLWPCTLRFMRTFPESWDLVNARKHVLPRLWSLLRLEAFESAEVTYSSLLPLLNFMPLTLTRDDGQNFYSEFFAALWHPTHDNTTGRRPGVEARPWIGPMLVSYRECLTFSVLQHHAADELATSLLEAHGTRLLSNVLLCESSLGSARSIAMREFTLLASTLAKHPKTATLAAAWIESASFGGPFIAATESLESAVLSPADLLCELHAELGTSASPSLQCITTRMVSVALSHLEDTAMRSAFSKYAALLHRIRERMGVGAVVCAHGKATTLHEGFAQLWSGWISRVLHVVRSKRSCSEDDAHDLRCLELGLGTFGAVVAATADAPESQLNWEEMWAILSQLSGELAIKACATLAHELLSALVGELPDYAASSICNAVLEWSKLSIAYDVTATVSVAAADGLAKVFAASLRTNPPALLTEAIVRCLGQIADWLQSCTKELSLAPEQAGRSPSIDARISVAIKVVCSALNAGALKLLPALDMLHPIISPLVDLQILPGTIASNIAVEATLAWSAAISVLQQFDESERLRILNLLSAHIAAAAFKTPSGMALPHAAARLAADVIELASGFGSAQELLLVLIPEDIQWCPLADTGDCLQPAILFTTELLRIVGLETVLNSGNGRQLTGVLFGLACSHASQETEDGGLFWKAMVTPFLQEHIRDDCVQSLLKVAIEHSIDPATSGAGTSPFAAIVQSIFAVPGGASTIQAQEQAARQIFSVIAAREFGSLLSSPTSTSAVQVVLPLLSRHLIPDSPAGRQCSAWVNSLIEHCTQYVCETCSSGSVSDDNAVILANRLRACTALVDCHWNVSSALYMSMLHAVLMPIDDGSLAFDSVPLSVSDCIGIVSPQAQPVPLKRSATQPAAPALERSSSNLLSLEAALLEFGTALFMHEPQNPDGLRAALHANDLTSHLVLRTQAALSVPFTRSPALSIAALEFIRQQLGPRPQREFEDSTIMTGLASLCSHFSPLLLAHCSAYASALYPDAAAPALRQVLFAVPHKFISQHASAANSCNLFFPLLAHRLCDVRCAAYRILHYIGPIELRSAHPSESADGVSSEADEALHLDRPVLGNPHLDHLLRPVADLQHPASPGFLLGWCVLLEIRELGSQTLQRFIASQIKARGLLECVLREVLLLLPLETNKPQPRRFMPSLLSELQGDELLTELAQFVYIACLQSFPALSRQWWCNLSPAQAQSIERFTTRHVTPHILKYEMDIINSPSNGVENITVRASTVSREVTATYLQDSTTLEVVIKLSQSHPLRAVEVDGTKRMGVTEGKWRKWVLHMVTCISNRDGRLLDAIRLWQQNLDKEFEGVEDCPICYAVLHMTTNQLPRMACKTCKHKFHSACLYKWFNTSHKSNCPLCQSSF
jgi:hypothetical protein